MFGVYVSFTSTNLNVLIDKFNYVKSDSHKWRNKNNTHLYIQGYDGL